MWPLKMREKENVILQYAAVRCGTSLRQSALVRQDRQVAVVSHSSSEQTDFYRCREHDMTLH